MNLAIITAFPIEYNAGKAPEAPNEIALSSLNAEEFGKQAGDTIEIITGEGPESFVVSGIYSNILNGGKTAKAAFSDETAPAMWLNYYIQLNHANQAAVTAKKCHRFCHLPA